MRRGGFQVSRCALGFALEMCVALAGTVATEHDIMSALTRAEVKLPLSSLLLSSLEFSDAEVYEP